MLRSHSACLQLRSSATVGGVSVVVVLVVLVGMVGMMVL